MWQIESESQIPISQEGKEIRCLCDISGEMQKRDSAGMNDNGKCVNMSNTSYATLGKVGTGTL